MRLPHQPRKDGAVLRSSSTKIRVVATVDRNLCQEMGRIHVQEVERAKTEDRTEPKWSNTIDMLLRKGVRSYRSDQRITWKA